MCVCVILCVRACVRARASVLLSFLFCVHSAWWRVVAFGPDEGLGFRLYE